jgi:glycerol-3-phosphate acyltransferase PlsY
LLSYQIVIGIIIAYLLGSIPTAVWVGKAFYKLDVRDHGSGNAGATNVVRVLGWKAGIPVMLVDIIKGWFAVWLGTRLFGGYADPLWIESFRIGMALAAVLGHVYPVFAGFRGGKGIATLLGVGIALYPVSIWVPFGLFFLVLFATGYVSVSSMIAAGTFWLVDIFLFRQEHIPLIVLSVFIGIFVLYTHRNNIQRLIKREEPRFLYGSRKK